MEEVATFKLIYGIRPPLFAILSHENQKYNNTIACSIFRPHVLASDHIRIWSAPHSSMFHTSVLAHLPSNYVLKLLDVMLISIKVKTWKNYRASLLHFHQFCNTRKIPESLRMPAPDHLLAAFIASCARKVAGSTIQNWLAGIHFWHNIHGAPLAWQLGELLINLVNSFDASHHVSHSAPLCHGHCVPFIILTILWTKTTHREGVSIIASRIDDMSNPVLALAHHLSANSLIPDDTPFFAFKTAKGSWAPMMCHCFRIGGATELLLRGTPSDVVAMQEWWKSRAFLEYRRKIDSILPMFITSSFPDLHTTMVQLSMNTFSYCYH
ncbi:hypothetical protein C8R48DRAFT_749018 [Suillus tomentosus]|nr:hypothetical protein C8R48DRAFT_749018 [Suillus tomentosus]